MVFLQFLDLLLDEMVDRLDGNLVEHVDRELLRLVRAESQPAQLEFFLAIKERHGGHVIVHCSRLE